MTSSHAINRCWRYQPCQPRYWKCIVVWTTARVMPQNIPDIIVVKAINLGIQLTGRADHFCSKCETLFLPKEMISHLVLMLKGTDIAEFRRTSVYKCPVLAYTHRYSQQYMHIFSTSLQVLYIHIYIYTHYMYHINTFISMLTRSVPPAKIKNPPRKRHVTCCSHEKHVYSTVHGCQCHSSKAQRAEIWWNYCDWKLWKDLGAGFSYLHLHLN